MMAIHVDESESGLGWGNNCLNCYSSRNSVQLMSANGQYIGTESGTSWCYSEMANMVFPGKNSITSLTDQTTTNLKSWDNLNSNVSLTEITKISNSDNISFKVNGGASFGVQVHTLAPTQITHTSAKISGSTQASLQGDQTIVERWRRCRNYFAKFNFKFL